MMKALWVAYLGMVICSVHAEGNALLDAVSVGVGQSQDDISIYRFGVRRDSEFWDGVSV